MEKLTKEQIFLMENVRKGFVDKFDSLEFDEDKARELVKFVYKVSCREEPYVILVDSPLVIIDILSKMRDNNQTAHRINENIKNVIYQRIDNQISQNVNREIIVKIREYMDGIEHQTIEKISGKIFENIYFDLPYKPLVVVYYGKGIREELLEDLEIFNTQVLGFYDFFERIGILRDDLFTQYKSLMECNVFASLLLEKCCFISRPPVFLKKDERGELHCDSDYAVFFKDGVGLHYLSGIYFSPGDFEKYVRGKKASTEEILKVENVEQKSALIRLYGYKKLLNQLPNLKIIDEFNVENNGKIRKQILYSFDITKGHKVKILALDDSSTDRQYFLGVPPEMEKVKDALAWTFQLENGSDYEMVLES